MSKTWTSPKWREKRAAYLKEHPNCEMTGCTNPATVINHRVKANVGLAKWREIYRNAERSKKNSLLTTHELTALTDEKYAAFKSRVSETYLDFTPETVEALCKRCHYARDHGKVLCLRCKTNYHNPRYPVCYECDCKKKGIEPKPYKKPRRKKEKAKPGHPSDFIRGGPSTQTSSEAPPQSSGSGCWPP